MSNKIKTDLKLIPFSVWGAIFLGAILRYIGIWYGLPLQLNIDEPALISTAIKLKSNINPGHYDWPHLYFYINGLAYIIYYLIRGFLEFFFELPDSFSSPSAFFLVSRILTATIGTLTIPVIYMLTKRIFNIKAGIIAAFVLAVLPIHVYESHLAKTDVAQTFLTVISLIFIYNVYRHGNRKDFILSGIFIGLTTGTKYGGILLFFSLLLGYLLGEKNHKKWFSLNTLVNFLLAGVIAFTMFLITTPFALLDYQKFFSTERGVGAVWQIQNVGSVDWVRYPIELHETFLKMYQTNLGVGLWIVFIILLILFLFFNKRATEYIFLLLPVVLFSFYISRFNRSPDHYFLFLSAYYVPALAMFQVDIIRWIRRLFHKTDWTSIQNIINSKYFAYAFLGIILVPSFFASFRITGLFARDDTRLIAYEWITQNLDDDDFLYTVGEDLSAIEFKDNNTSRIKKLEKVQIEEPTPFYVIIGVEGLSEKAINSGTRDPEELEGNSEPILTDADLLLSINDDGRRGPPVYIFRVNSIQPD